MLAEPDSRLPSQQRATVWADLALAHALMGHAGAAGKARLLLERIADRQRPTAQISLSRTLVVRHTTAAAPG